MKDLNILEFMYIYFYNIIFFRENFLKKIFIQIKLKIIGLGLVV